jgi:hypothetical protein
MQTIRSDLPGSVEDACENVNNLLDWKYYVWSYPQFILPIIAATAYVIVPRSRRAEASPFAFLDSDAGVRRVRLVDDTVPNRSIVAGVVSSLLTFALRSGSSMAIRHLSEMLHGPRNQE